MKPSLRADKIIEFSLRHIPFDGWTMEALRRGAVDAEENPDEAVMLFKNSSLVMIEYYSLMLDRQMKEIVVEKGLEDLKIRERIATCVTTCLHLMAPYRESAQKAATILSMPQNTLLATKLLYKTVDTMWYCAGDNATDFNFYTKRGLLSLVYTSTLLYWFKDTSTNYANTQAFLGRRIDNVMMIPKLKAKPRGLCERLTNQIRNVFGGE